MGDDIWPELGNGRRYGFTVAHVCSQELVARMAIDVAQGSQVACICQFVYVKNAMFCIQNQVANQGRTYESGPTGNENTCFRSNHIKRLLLRCNGIGFQISEGIAIV